MKQFLTLTAHTATTRVLYGAATQSHWDSKMQVTCFGHVIGECDSIKMITCQTTLLHVLSTKHVKLAGVIVDVACCTGEDLLETLKLSLVYTCTI